MTIVFTAAGNALSTLGHTPLTSGSVNIFRAEFSFDAAWVDMERTAVFRTARHNISVLLGKGSSCTIPWEVLDAEFDLHVAVFGMQGGVKVLTTNYVNTGPVLRGADTTAPVGQAPTPSQYEQIMAAIRDVRDNLGGIVEAGGFVTQQDLETWSASIDKALEDLAEAAAKFASLDSGKIPYSELPKGVEVVEEIYDRLVPVEAWAPSAMVGEPSFTAKIMVDVSENPHLTDPSPEVIFSAADANGGNLSASGGYVAGGVTIFAFDKPSTPVTVPLIRMRRCVK